MISLDQVLLLQEKVESAVEKITSLTERISQLESDNDALNRKCLELTKALEEKTEFVSTIESAQNKIEESILKAINRLDSVEDAILGNDAESGDAVATSNETLNIPADEIEANNAGNQQTETERNTEEPFIYENNGSEQNSSSTNISEQEKNMESPQVFDDSEGKENVPESPAPSALDGQFDIF